MYHGIHAGPDSPGVFDARYSVGVERFAEQLDWLARNDFRTVRLGQEREERDVVLTFDDGDVSFVTAALPMLLERGMVAEFCVTTDYVGRPGMIDTDGVRRLAEHGMGVQSHARTHRCLDGLSPEELSEELVTSKRQLEQWSGRPVQALSAPGGRAGLREYQAARAAGYRFVLNSVPGPNRRASVDGYLRRLPVTRGVSIDAFGQLVRWKGTAPRVLTLRSAILEVPKLVLGNEGYDAIRRAVRRR